MNAKDAAARETAAVPAEDLAFGDFRLSAGPLRLSFKGEGVRLGSRALALLQALLSRPGTIFSRGELVALVWPSTVVEDSSLRVHMAALRRALGDGADGVRYIVNVPGRGYSFVAPVSRVGAGAAAPAPPQAGRIDNLPASLTRLFGRDAVTATLCAELAARRLVSIVGHGGIGKTTLALAVAAQAQAHYPAGVSFVDLAPLTAGSHVTGTVASALGMPLPAEATLARLEDWLRPRRLLLVMDNCEHLLDDVAALVERILKRAPGLAILTTSREPLDTEGDMAQAAECVRRGQEERFPAALSQSLCLAAIPVALWQGDDAQAMFRQALARAERQGAKGWALRAANSLARLRRAQGRCADARDLLLPWLPRLDAMGASADAAETRALLDGGRSS